MRALFYLLFLLVTLQANAQTSATPKLLMTKQLQAQRTTAVIKIDGLVDEEAWKAAVPATDFVEWRPTPGVPEAETNKTVVYLLYDNTSVYIGGFCHEQTRDSISKELVGRDVVGVNDFVGVIFDTYNDKINGFGFYVTPMGEQFDAKYSSTAGEDGNWSAVWDSEARIHDGGWSFEMRIPYSALRFSNNENQTWGLNITRRRNKTGQQYMWSAVDPKINGFMNQSGKWTGIEKIQSPVRLSLSPYLSAYVNHYPENQKAWSSSINGGMDVKYGISESFTLDATLVPDFGQVQSDNQVLNLSPFEVKFAENRAFFTEGTELFSKGNLFYSRRIGATPLHYYGVEEKMATNERIVKNPQESKLINATKISGRTKGGLGIGFFNAITKPMYALVEDDAKKTREIQTAPLTNYNILVFDQTLKNNSSVSFINTNVTRNGSDYDANVSSALFNINNKKNTYMVDGNVSVSAIGREKGKTETGYAHTVTAGKVGGNLMFQLSQELYDDKYDKNDMGIMFNNNYLDHYLWIGYRWLKPGKWYNSMGLNYNNNFSSLYKKFDNQKVNTYFQTYNTNINGNVQLKNLWYIGMLASYAAESNDFYEPREKGWSYRAPQNIRFNIWTESNSAKKYKINLSYTYSSQNLLNGKSFEYAYFQRYRFSDKFSLSQSLTYSPAFNNVGFYDKVYSNGSGPLQDIVFSRRNRNTVENLLSAKYNFNNKSGISLRARHYWSRVTQKQLYDLQTSGELQPTKHQNMALEHQNFNAFTVDAVYTLQFAPGSFVNLVWKDAIFAFDESIQYRYFKNFNETIGAPQNNNLSIKIIYFLDYLDLKKKRKAGKV